MFPAAVTTKSSLGALWSWAGKPKWGREQKKDSSCTQWPFLGPWPLSMTTQCDQGELPTEGAAPGWLNIPRKERLGNTVRWFTKFTGSWECLLWKPQKWEESRIPPAWCLGCLEACYISELAFQPAGRKPRTCWGLGGGVGGRGIVLVVIWVTARNKPRVGRPTVKTGLFLNPLPPP